MSAVLEHQLEPSAATSRRTAMLQAVHAVATGPLQRAAGDIDRGLYPEAILRQLGRAGAFAAQLTGQPGGADFGAAVEAIADVSSVCASTGFMMWCQAACGLYLEHSGNPALGGAALARHTAAASLGGTALSNPLKTFSGIETMLLRARAVAGGYRVSGTLPWVSNLGPGHYFGAVAAVDDEPGAPREIMFMVRCGAADVELRDCPSFAGMEGTGTYGVRLQNAFIGPDDLIAADVQPFLSRIRAAFVLLQCGMGLGVARGAIASMWDVEPQLGAVNQFLDDRPAPLQAELDALTARTMALAATPYGGGRDFLVDALDVRAHASELALRAAQSALLHQGARGYLMTSAVQRRVRESHFVAIVTPALKHLRKEIARLQTAEMPS